MRTVHKICLACWSYLDLLRAVALLNQVTAVDGSRSEETWGLCSCWRGKWPSPPVSSFDYCQQPPSAASFSTLDPALAVFWCLGTAVFSPLLQPVLHSWIASVMRVSELLVCISKSPLYWLQGKPTRSEFQKELLGGSQEDKAVW